MKDTISDHELLLIRQCKRNKVNINILYKIVGRMYALDHRYVKKDSVIHALMKIVIKYDLIRDWSEFVITNLNPKKWYSNEEKPYIDNLLDELISKIAVSEISKFPRYRSPLRFRIDKTLR